MGVQISHLLWNHSCGHDKIWVIAKIDNDAENDLYYVGWGKRGKKLLFQSANSSIFKDVSKKITKGYIEYRNNPNAVFDNFIEVFSDLLMTSKLFDKIGNRK